MTSDFQVDRQVGQGLQGLLQIFEPHPPNLKIYTTFKDVQMMLKIFFDT